MADAGDHSYSPINEGLEVVPGSGPERHYPPNGLEFAVHAGVSSHRSDSKLPVSSKVPETHADRSNDRMRRWILLSCVALVAALVTGGAVGGGLGASLASCRSDLQ